MRVIHAGLCLVVLASCREAASGPRPVDDVRARHLSECRYGAFESLCTADGVRVVGGAADGSTTAVMVTMRLLDHPRLALEQRFDVVDAAAFDQALQESGKALCTGELLTSGPPSCTVKVKGTARLPFLVDDGDGARAEGTP